MKETECENNPTAETEDDEHESSRREEEGLDQAEGPLSHVQPDFSMDTQSSPGEGGSPLESNTERPEAGGQEWGKLGEREGG